MKKLIILCALMVIMLDIIAINPFSKLYNKHFIRESGWRFAGFIAQDYQNDNWINSGQYEMCYNSDEFSSPDSILIYEYNSNSWQLNGIIEITYNQNHEFITQVDQYYIGDNERILVMHQDILYNNDNHLTNMFLYNYSDLEMAMVPYSRMHIIYDGSIIDKVYQWNLDEENNQSSYSKMSFEFDNVGRIIEEYDETSSDSLNWENTYHTIRTYHTQDTTTGEIMIDNISHDLPLLMIINGDGEPNFGKLSETIGEQWINGQWINENRRTYSYDEMLNEIFQLEQYWNNSIWINNSNATFSYDVNNNMIEALGQSWEESAWHNQYKTFISWEEYVGNDDETLSSIEKSIFNIYPNPIKDNFSISSKIKVNSDEFLVELFNLKGQLVQTSYTKLNHPISIKPSISSGIYFLKISSKEVQVNKKIIYLK